MSCINSKKIKRVRFSREKSIKPEAALPKWPTGAESITIEGQDGMWIASTSIGLAPLSPDSPRNVSGDNDVLWVESITTKLQQAFQSDEVIRWDKPCIYKIPASLKHSTDSEIYIPQVVSIGPYYRHQENLQEMERHKWRAVHHILKRTQQEVNGYLQVMTELEDKTRACYTGPLNLTSNEFVEMMMFDGCFILECLRGMTEGFQKLGYAHDDPVFSLRSTTLGSLGHDMLMLENQLPLFVLDKLLNIQNVLPPQVGPVSKLALKFFQPFMPIYRELMNNGEQDAMHCIDLIRQYLLRDNDVTQSQTPIVDNSSNHAGQQHFLDVVTRSIQTMKKLALKIWWRRQPNISQEVDERIPLVPCVTNLIDAGVEFRVKRNTGKFWDVTYENGVIHMPKILVDDMTKSLFFNIMAYEQCHLSIPWASCTITSYVRFLDMLIDSGQDVSYLRSRDIIEHTCGSDAEAAYQLDSLAKGIIFPINDCYLAPLCKEVNRYYNKRWNVWRAMLKQRYFNNPWGIISFVAAVLLLLFTFGQTLYAIYGYYKPPT